MVLGQSKFQTLLSFRFASFAIPTLFYHPSMEKASQRLQERIPAEEVKLAAAAIRLNARLNSSDMAIDIQEHALRCARSFLDSAPKRRPNPSHLARILKKEFDSEYGPAWHCVVGTSFGSFVTHSQGGFMYSSIDSFSVLLFKTEVILVEEPES